MGSLYGNNFHNGSNSSRLMSRQRSAITLQQSAEIARSPTCEIPMARVYSAPSLLEPREDFDDFSQFAVRVLASTAHAGRFFCPLTGTSAGIDRV
jgi:hypothetical protein